MIAQLKSGTLKLQDWTLQDWTLTDDFAGMTIAGLLFENNFSDTEHVGKYSSAVVSL